MGLTVANLLASRGVPVLVVERNAGTSDEAKAISIDDESLRAYAAAGLADAVLAIVVPGTGTKYYDRHGRAVLHASGPKPGYRRGFPFKNQFSQPELETVLLQGLKERPGVEVRFNTELLSFMEHPDGAVEVQLRETGTDRVTSEDVSWVLACDGGRSTVREIAGIAMTGTSYDEVWVVVDTVGDEHRERYGMHLGMPTRPTVIVPGRETRCRYEFLQFPGEVERGAKPDLATVQHLLAPYRTITEEQVERSTAYTFNAVVADRWRAGRAFLLGDAAHMMPPFAGQGLNSGVRDAANLAWKLAGVWHGTYGEQLLDTYEAERKPHAAATVALSERLGRVVMTTSRRRALVRDLVVRAMLRTGRGRDYLTQMRFRPVARHASGLVAVGSSPLLGLELPQPLVLMPPDLRPRRLDEVLGNDFALVGVDVTPDGWAKARDAFDGVLPYAAVDVVLGDRLPQPTSAYQSVADVDGALDAAVSPAKGSFLLVKPDRYVAAVFAPEQASNTASTISGQLMAAPLTTPSGR